MKDKIITHQLNNSLTKQSFSFGKECRFLPIIKNNNFHKFYDYPPVKIRSTSFGYGEKSKLQNPSFSPPPGTYQIKSTLHQTKFTFGLGRQLIKGGPIPKVQKNKNMPGPGQYLLPSSLQNKNIYFGRKFEDHWNNKRKQQPGPGSYELDKNNIINSGKYMLSNQKNPIRPSLKSKSQIIQQMGKGSPGPGPGTYNPKLVISAQGKYFISRFKSNAGQRFGNAKRQSLAKRQSQKQPGPGSYNIFSQFDHQNSYSLKLK